MHRTEVASFVWDDESYVGICTEVVVVILRPFPFYDRTYYRYHGTPKGRNEIFDVEPRTARIPSYLARRAVT